MNLFGTERKELFRTLAIRVGIPPRRLHFSLLLGQFWSRDFDQSHRIGDNIQQFRSFPSSTYCSLGHQRKSLLFVHREMVRPARPHTRGRARLIWRCPGGRQRELFFRTSKGTCDATTKSSTSHVRRTSMLANFVPTYCHELLPDRPSLVGWMSVTIASL